MSASIQMPSSSIQSLLGMQAKVGRPSQQVCTVIANLRDLCELQTAGIGSDWRRGPSGEGVSQRAMHTGGGGGGRPVFRTSGFGTGGGGGGSGSPSPYGSGLPRITPQRSYGSLSSASGPSTPSAAGGGGQANSPVPSTPGSGRYQSMFKNSTQPVEDKIVNNILLGKMNKFSGKTYKETRDFLYQILGSGEAEVSDMIRDFMLLVFKKAAQEETFRHHYAKLICELSERYKVILEEMHTLQASYLEIFEDVEEVPEGGDNYKKFLEKNEEKQYRQGYSQFLAECVALEMLDLSNLERTFGHLSGLLLKYGNVEGKKTLMEEYAFCLEYMTKVLTTKSSAFFTRARQALFRVCFPAIDTLLASPGSYVSLSPKARCILMNVKDNLSK